MALDKRYLMRSYPVRFLKRHFHWHFYDADWDLLECVTMTAEQAKDCGIEIVSPIRVVEGQKRVAVRRKNETLFAADRIAHMRGE